MSAPCKSIRAGDELCTITLVWSDALLLAGVFNQAIQKTEREFNRGLCSFADFETERAISNELQRQVLFRLPPSADRRPA